MIESNRDNTERDIFDLQNVIDIGLSLSSNLEFDSLIESILYIFIGNMLIDRAAFFVYSDIEDEGFTLYMSRGYTFESDLKIEHESILINYLYSHGDIIDVIDANDLMLNDPLTKDVYEKLEPEIIIPLKSKNSVNGIIFLGKKIMKTPYSTQEIQFLGRIAKFASAAVENSRLYRMATIDKMTGLYINHYFQERLTIEIKRSVRSNDPLTLLVANIDHFKSVNDTYGNHQGDIILKGTGKIIRQTIRSIDIASRFSGEEFSIILTQTDIDGALIIAERLREKIESEIYSNEITDINVTISIGLAQYDNQNNEGGIDLIKKAESALYLAKKRGRNMTVIYEGTEGK